MADRRFFCMIVCEKNNDTPNRLDCCALRILFTSSASHARGNSNDTVWAVVEDVLKCFEHKRAIPRSNKRPNGTKRTKQTQTDWVRTHAQQRGSHTTPGRVKQCDSTSLEYGDGECERVMVWRVACVERWIATDWMLSSSINTSEHEILNSRRVKLALFGIETIGQPVAR